jgi:ankyrin repeat protein
MRKSRRLRPANPNYENQPSIPSVVGLFQSDVNQTGLHIHGNQLAAVNRSSHDHLLPQYTSFDVEGFQRHFQVPFQHHAVLEDFQISDLNFDLLDQLNPFHAEMLNPISMNISGVCYDALSSTPRMHSNPQEAFRRSRGFGERDVLKLIIFMLDNNLLQDHQTRQVFLHHAQAISPLALSSVNLRSDDHGIAETIDKVFSFALEANNRSIVISAIRNRLQVSASLMDAAFVYALRNEDILLVQFLLAESNLNLALNDPCANSDNWSINPRNRFEPRFLRLWKRPESALGQTSTYDREYHSDATYSSVEYVASRHNRPLLLTLLQARASPTTSPISGKNGSVRAINPLFAAILRRGSGTITETVSQENRHTCPESALNVVHTLVENGADVNSEHPWLTNYDYSIQVLHTKLNYSPICAAAYIAYPPLVTYLFDQGAAVHRGSGGQYALLSLTGNLNHCNTPSAFETAKILLDKGVDISICAYDNGFTALDYAIQHNRPELIELLQSKGAKFTRQSLELAISAGSVRMADQILDYMFAAEDKAMNPLDFLVEVLMNDMNHIATKLLNLARTTGHVWPSDKLSCIPIGCRSDREPGRFLGLKRAILFLLNSGTVPPPTWIPSCMIAVVDNKNIRHLRTLMNLAVEYSTSGVLEWHSSIGHDALHLAVSEQAYDLVDLLLEGGAIPHSETISSALMTEDFHLFHRLLQRRLELALFPHQKILLIPPESRSVLIRLKNHPPILRTLLAIERRDKSFSSFATCAVEQDDFDALNILLKWGYALNRRWLDKLVEVTVKRGKVGILHEILQLYQKSHGHCEGSFGSGALRSAIDMANKSELSEKAFYMGEKLLSFGVDPLAVPRGHRRLGISCSGLGRVISGKTVTNKSKWVHLVIQSITNIDSVIETEYARADAIVSENGGERTKWHLLAYTPLLLAILAKDVSTVEILLDAGADINLPATIQTRRTPLQAACDFGNWDIFLLLLRKGADVHAPAAACKGGTALQLAAIQGNLKMVCKLLEIKADANAPGAKFGGRTALEGAAEYGRVGVLELLLDCGFAKIDGDGDVQYQKALKFAERNGHRKALLMLKAAKERRLGAETSPTFRPQC